MNSTAFFEITKEIPFNDEAQNYLKEIVQELSLDLSPDHPGFYSDETTRCLYSEAAHRLKVELAKQPQPVDFQTLRNTWAQVVIDYHRNNNWNYPVEAKKPKRPLTEEQRNAREVALYIFIAIQTVLVLKTAVFYFGMHSASQPSETNNTMLVVTIISLLVTLAYFIWNRSQKEPKE